MKLNETEVLYFLETPLNSKSDHFSITSIAISPDGTKMAAAIKSFGPDIQIWDLEKKQLLHLLKGDHQDLISMAFSYDNKLLLTSHGAWGGIRLYNAEEGILIKELLNGMYYGSVAFKNDQLLASKRNTNIWVWNSNFECLLEGDDDSGNDKINTFSKDGNFFVTIKSRKTPQMFESISRKKIMEFKKQDEDIIHVSVTNNADLLATLSKDSIARIWKVSDGTNVAELGDSFKTYENSASCNISNNHKWLVIGRHDGLLQIWNLIEKKKIIEDKVGYLPIKALEFTPDSNQLIVGSGSGHLFQIKLPD